MNRRVNEETWIFRSAMALAVAWGALVCGLTADDKLVAADEVAPADLKSAAPTGVRRALLFCGLPGDKEHRKLFVETLLKLQQTLTERYGFPASEIRVQFGGAQADADGPSLASVTGGATREELKSEVSELRSVLQPDDALWVIVMGHAHFDGKRTWLNLPGPDIHEQDFAKLFSDVKCREQVFFMTTPVSGYSIRSLSAAGRVIFTATEADLEVNETVYPHALAEVLSGPIDLATLDVDKDGALTLFDLYITLTRNIAHRYIDAENLPTEHALLDDNGDKRGTEVQRHWLTPDEGGRYDGKKAPPAIKPNADGALSSRTVLPLPPM